MAWCLWLPFLLFTLTSADFFPDPIAARARSLGIGPAAKNSINRERLAIYNLLDSPALEENQDSEVSPYAPPQMLSPQVSISSQEKELPFSPAVFAPGLPLFPLKPVRAPYATPQFMPPIYHHQLYPHQPVNVYAPTFPYVYKSHIQEES
ncbi:hypothetical protein J437_LFUL012247 [Ladona fulva]|uniref:Beta-casein n=1 Tax=Ladona fulva TaxID=123851 RepID=A0A8K0P1E0_LADFU|nr:hypothetical protein J437_LFUL012247 [Ladona fulva]